MANVISPLEEAAKSGDINRLYALIEANPYILEDVEAIPFVETPLHTAASAGHIHFATEIMRLKPSFALKLDTHGLSPVHLAIQKGHGQLVRRLVDINNDLVRVKGREGITPLHTIVSQKGEAQVLAYFLEVCPDTIEDVTVRRETALHVALKHQQLEALQVLIGWLRTNTRRGAATLERSILNWKDEGGNTILHLSALNHDIQALNLLIKCKRLNLNSKNSENRTALDRACSTEMERELQKVGAKRGSSVKDDPTLATQLKLNIALHRRIIIRVKRTRHNISDIQRESYLVVAALLLTGIYQTVLSPPAGKSVLSASGFVAILAINTLVLLVTTLTILTLILSSSVGFLLLGPIFSFAFSYLYSMQLISPTTGGRHIATVMMVVYVVIYCLVAIEMMMNLPSTSSLTLKAKRFYADLKLELHKFIA
ncbi:ankyrin repeat-containing protein BDA1-like [Arachis duranensis]|uniref:Ankyrin repeat-containing protein BDA1-like n=1 Tax=Arachis duranensis TaxID=130453 RepID=A0A6P4CK38_ARADU|nr:ankyrin repeat-containing protein BDA1-like [Arachis duranensis]